MNEFGNFLKNFMALRDLKLEYMAEKTGVSFGLIGHYINGRRSPSYKFLKSFFDAFNLSEKEQKEIMMLIELDKMPEELRKIRKKDNNENDITQISKNMEKGNARRIKTAEISLYGKASAGPGYLNLSDELDNFIIPVDDYKPGRFAVNVDGDSMTGPGKSIPDGSVALVDPMLCCDVSELIGKVCVFTYHDETYIKQLIIENNIIYLVSFNPEVRDIVITDKKNLKCEGRVIKTYFEQRW